MNCLIFFFLWFLRMMILLSVAHAPLITSFILDLIIRIVSFDTYLVRCYQMCRVPNIHVCYFQTYRVAYLARVGMALWNTSRNVVHVQKSIECLAKSTLSLGYVRIHPLWFKSVHVTSYDLWKCADRSLAIMYSIYINRSNSKRSICPHSLLWFFFFLKPNQGIIVHESCRLRGNEVMLEFKLLLLNILIVTECLSFWTITRWKGKWVYY